MPAACLADPRVTVSLGDLCDETTIETLLLPEGCDRVITIHLAALLSGYAEDNFDLGMKVNLYGTLNVMERVRARSAAMGSPQTYCYVSTDYVACFNDYNRTHAVTEESFRLSPVSYGCQKACNEILISDYTRKGFLDGRVARLSAVIGRPGFSNSISSRKNGAASSRRAARGRTRRTARRYPYTGIFTQPLEGKDYDVPLPMDVPYPCSSLNTDVDALLFLATAVDSAAIGHNRVVQLPCESFTLREIWAATEVVAKEEGVALGTVKQVAASAGATTVTEINVCPRVSCAKAAALGCPMTVDLKEIIRDYVTTYIKKP